MLKFLNDLDANTDKHKYQKYSIKLGIESFNILMPYQNVTKFDTALTAASIQKTDELKKIVESFNGIIE